MIPQHILLLQCCFSRKRFHVSLKVFFYILHFQEKTKYRSARWYFAAIAWIHDLIEHRSFFLSRNVVRVPSSSCSRRILVCSIAPPFEIFYQQQHHPPNLYHNQSTISCPNAKLVGLTGSTLNVTYATSDSVPKEVEIDI